MGKGYVLVEVHGELKAADNLISRLSADLGIPRAWSPAIRWPNLHQKNGLQKGANFMRTKQDVDALLIFRDEDDACPKHRGPSLAAWLRELCLPFPSAIVLLHPEYEVLLRRGIKEWLTSHFPPNRSYKPTLDQLPLTRLIDFSVLRQSNLPCFGTLERALQFLAKGEAGSVYPSLEGSATRR